MKGVYHDRRNRSVLHPGRPDSRPRHRQSLEVIMTLGQELGTMFFVALAIAVALELYLSRRK